MDQQLAMHTYHVFNFTLKLFTGSPNMTGADMWKKIEAIADGAETMAVSAAEMIHYSDAAAVAAQKHQNDLVKREREIAAMIVSARDGFST